MAKPQALGTTDLIPAKLHAINSARQRGVVPSAELVPMQFRMPPDWVKEFKQAALDRGLKLNEMLKACFAEMKKAGK
jgi:hypothetical protein